jgi:HPt (histidine-containing phosphotransfer) domain-containing protein
MGKSSGSVAAGIPLSAELEPAIDLVHLSRTTFGDQRLQCEILQLFDRQAGLLLARMKDAPTFQVAELAHTLKGSANGVGARSLARAAEMAELAAGAHDEPHLTAALKELAAAVQDARAAAMDLLRSLSAR